MKNKCNCDLCKRDRKFEKIIKRMKQFEIFDKDVKWLRSLYQELLGNEEVSYLEVDGVDIREYYRCQK